MAKLQITIDDGPLPIKTALTALLAELKRRKVKAAFFVLGEEVQAAPAATKSIAGDGHVLANHSWDHLMPSTTKFLDADIVKQFQDTHAEVKTAANVTMQFWRAPRLEQISRISGLIVGAGKLYTMSHCDVHADSRDSQGVTTADGMLKSLRATIKAASGRTTFRLLFHVLPHTAQAFRTVLDGLEADGHTLADFQQLT